MSEKLIMIVLVIAALIVCSFCIKWLKKNGEETFIFTRLEKNILIVMEYLGIIGLLGVLSRAFFQVPIQVILIVIGAVGLLTYAVLIGVFRLSVSHLVVKVVTALSILFIVGFLGPLPERLFSIPFELVLIGIGTVGLIAQMIKIIVED